MLLRKQNPCLGFPDFDAEMFDYALVVFRVCHTSAGAAYSQGAEG